jgi:release factor glutamine methyltransferase
VRFAPGVRFALGDWWAPLAGQRFDLVVSNPPYVAPGDPHLAALRHEPAAALVPARDGGDGLSALEAVVEGAARHLAPAGFLLLEHGHDQGEAVRALLARHGFAGATTRHDLAGWPRATGAGHP